MDFDRLLSVLRALNARGVRYKIFGAVALNALGLARATEDLDLFLEPTDDNVARLRAALQDVYADPSIDEITAGDLLGDYPAVQYVPPDGVLRIDILTRLGEAFGYDDIEVQDAVLDDVPCRVATPRMLYRMKKDTVRPRDHADAARLRQHFNLEDD